LVAAKPHLLYPIGQSATLLLLLGSIPTAARSINTATRSTKATSRDNRRVYQTATLPLLLQ